MLKKNGTTPITMRSQESTCTQGKKTKDEASKKFLQYYVIHGFTMPPFRSPPNTDRYKTSPNPRNLPRIRLSNSTCPAPTVLVQETSHLVMAPLAWIPARIHFRASSSTKELP